MNRPGARNNAGPNQGTTSRIPLALQAVFLNGNRGIVVNTPPPEKAASKVYRSWWRRRPLDRTVSANSSGTEKTNSLTESTDRGGKPVEQIISPRLKKKKPAQVPTLTPQQYLDAMIKSRGYSTSTTPTLQSEFYHKPTPLQLASYGVYVVDLIRKEDVEGLEELMEAGLSPNASNSYGESIVHQICRRCSVLMLDVLLRAPGCEVITSDDHGRTPLHYACWAPEPNFPLVERLLEQDMRLLHMVDARGHTPLSYTRQDHWSEWLQFLNGKKEIYWPRRSKEEATAALTNLSSALNVAPKTNGNEISLEMAKMVAEGKLTPKEAIYLRSQDDESSSYDSEDDDDDDSDEEDETEEDDSDDESEEDDSDITEEDEDDVSVENPAAEENPASSEYDLEASWDLDEMKNVLDSLNKPNSRPLAW